MPLLPNTAITGPQPQQEDYGVSNVFTAGAITGGIAASGFLPFRGKRLWDHYLSGIRAIEAGSPGAILRTFRISETLSPLESVGRVAFSRQEAALSGRYTELMSRMFGESAAEGAVLKDVGRSGIGEVVAGGRTVGYGVSVAAPLRKGDAIADYYARISGMDLPLNQSISREYLRAQYKIQQPAAPFGEWIKTQRPRIILGAKLREEANILGRRILLSGRQQRALAKIEAVANLARARAAVTAGRLNVLLSRPFDLPVIGPVLSRIPGANKLAVKPGTSLQMARRFAVKGALLGLGWKGLEYYDYLRASGSAGALPFGAAAGAAIGGFMFRGAGRMFSPAGLAIGALTGAATAILPRFDEGLFYGLASIPADINLARARTSEAIGLSESLRGQEDLTPGLVSYKTALGFAGVGALAAGMYKYGTFLGKAAQERVAKGGALADIFKTIRSAEAEKIGKIWTETGLGKRLAGLPKVGKYISKIKHPMALGALAGFGAWLGLSTGLSLASGNVMAALPWVNLLGTTEDPEELEAIYSGEQEVPIRKGRWWEMGRSPYSGERIQYYRPHALARLRTRAYQKGMWGSEEEKWAYDPVLNPLKTLFGSDEWKYYYEQKYQYKRPAPLCLHPETPVLTKEGYKSIEDICTEDEVYNSKGEWTKVVNTANRNCYEKQLIEINIAADSRSVKTTPDHKILAIKNLWNHSKRDGKCRGKATIVQYGAPEWIPAKDISKSDLVLIPVPKVQKEYVGTLDLKSFVPYTASGEKVFLGHEIGQDIADAYLSDLPTNIAAKKFHVPYKRLYQLRRRHPKTINRYINIDRDFAYLLGWYIAEGWVGNKQGPYRLPSNVNFALCSDEQYFVDFLSDYSKRVFNATVSVYTCSENGIQARVNSNVFAAILEDLVGRKKAINKTIPEFVFNWPKGLKQQFIKGLIRGDGHYKKPSGKSKGEITFVSASSALTANLRLLLMSIGIKSSFREQRPNKNWEESKINGRVIKQNKSYILSITGPDYDCFAEFEELITQKNSTVSQKGILYDHMMFVPVRGTSFIPYSGKVYDITVEDDSCFLTTCIVHNSGTYGEDVPFIGPLVAATVGKALKPRKFVRPEEWMTPEGGVVPYEEKPELAPAYELGGLGPGLPVLPEDSTQVINELVYRRREAVGLPGFVAGAIQKGLTGREEYFQNLQTLGTMGDETGSEYWLWKHLNLGGAAGVSEPVRRFIPRTRSYLETYNPLEWNAPYWLPKDYFIDLRRGNIFKDIPEAEIRLPGPGYSSRFPELEGVDPNQYPLIHRLKILSDVAMWSDEYKATLAQANAVSSQMSDYEKDMLQTIKEQVRSKRKRREFTPYRFTEDLKPVSPEIEEKYSAVERTVGGLWEKIAHQAQTPLEYLTPMSPASKLIGQRSAIEEYVATEAVGTKSSFWDRPVENFLSPAAEMMEYKFGDRTIAEPHQRRRDIEEYFDMLKWVKNYRLEQEARARRDWQAAKEYEEARKKTLFGTNAFGNPVMAMAAMPRRERDFFSAFAGAETEEARREILSLVPEQVGRIYASRWASDELADIRDRKEEGIATKEDEKRENVLYAFKRTQGYAAEDVDELEEQWLEETGGEIPFAEWIRLKRAQKYFATHSLPGAEWLGWHSSIDMEDVKLKYVETAGLDYHDFDLWDDRERMLSRKPYIDSELLEQMNTRAALEDVLKLNRQASYLGKQMKASKADSRLHIINGDVGNKYNIEIVDSREGLSNKAYKELGA